MSDTLLKRISAANAWFREHQEELIRAYDRSIQEEARSGSRRTPWRENDEYIVKAGGKLVLVAKATKPPWSLSND